MTFTFIFTNTKKTSSQYMPDPSRSTSVGQVTPKDPKGRSMEPRFANVKRRGRSFTPPKAGALESWRCDHQAVECVIRRRRRKGPKEKLLILPCLATLDDPRFQHLFETLEAEQPDLMSESMLHLSCGARVN